MAVKKKKKYNNKIQDELIIDEHEVCLLREKGNCGMHSSSFFSVLVLLMLLFFSFTFLVTFLGSTFSSRLSAKQQWGEKEEIRKDEKSQRRKPRKDEDRAKT